MTGQRDSFSGRVGMQEPRQKRWRGNEGKKKGETERDGERKRKKRRKKRKRRRKKKQGRDWAEVTVTLRPRVVFWKLDRDSRQ